MTYCCCPIRSLYEFCMRSTQQSPLECLREFSEKISQNISGVISRVFPSPTQTTTQATVQEFPIEPLSQPQPLEQPPDFSVRYPETVACKTGEPKSDENQTSVEECSICLDEMSSSGILPCGHKIHIDCLKTWIEEKNPNVSCPLCRTPFTTVKLLDDTVVYVTN